MFDTLLKLEALKQTQADTWLTGEFHVSSLSDQFDDQEVILYANTQHLYVHTVLAPLQEISEVELAECM